MIAFLNFEQGLRYLMVPLSPHTYAALDPKRMFWNSLYFFGYVISIPLLALTMFFLGVRVLFRMTVHGMPLLDYIGSLHLPSQLRTAVVIDIVAVLTLLFGRLVVYPYSVALLYSLNQPTRLCRRIEMHRYAKGLETLAREVIPMVDSMNYLASATQLAQARNTIQDALTKYRHTWQHFDLQCLRWKLRFKFDNEASQRERANLLVLMTGLMSSTDNSFRLLPAKIRSTLSSDG
jgi:hypothetical protein